MAKRWCAEIALLHGKYIGAREFIEKDIGSIKILNVRDRERWRWIKKGIFGYIKNVNKKKNSCDSP